MKHAICIGQDFNIDNDIVLSDLTVVSQAVRVHLQNRRQGTVACKSRCDVISRSNKKPWRQKGTGRARAGSPRSPLWRGGGVCHGPQARVRTLSMSKKMNRNALAYLFLNLLDANKVICMQYDLKGYSTKGAFEVLKSAGLHNQKCIVFYDINDYDLYYSFANLSNVRLVSFDAVFPYVLAHDYSVIFMERDRDQMKALVSSWLN